MMWIHKYIKVLTWLLTKPTMTQETWESLPEGLLLLLICFVYWGRDPEQLWESDFVAYRTITLISSPFPLKKKKLRVFIEVKVSESESPCFIGYPNWNLRKEWTESRCLFLKLFFFDLHVCGGGRRDALIFLPESYRERQK